MSFGWSVGDIISGLKVVYDIWQAVSAGPLNASFEATQFFDEYTHIMSRLERWESQKSAIARDEALVGSQRQIREQCTLFIKNHFRLIQAANPDTISQREGRSTWLRKVPFSKEQVLALYKKVSWPFEREEVQRLRIKLQFFLDVATFDISMNTNRTLHRMRIDNADLMSSNLKLVTSHLELVSLVKENLRRITNPLEPGRQSAELDYPMLRQLDQALRMPQALPRPQQRLAIEAGQSQPALLRTQDHAQPTLPWMQDQRQNELVEAQYAVAPPGTSAVQDADDIDHNDIRVLIERRLDNLSMRVKRVETLRTISENESDEIASDEIASIQSLLDHLRNMRGRISSAVGVLRRPTSQNELSVTAADPEGALKAELQAWDLLEERMGQEILHPSRVRRQTGPTELFDIPRRQPPLSPRTRHNSRSSSISNSPDNRRLSDSTPPPHSDPRSHRRGGSHSELSIQVTLHCADDTVDGIIHSIWRNNEGDIQQISTLSNDRDVKIYHLVDFQAPTSVETSMKPFLDNRHVFPDEAHKWRVQFKGSHNLKIMTTSGSEDEKLFSLQCPPIYKFHHESDFKHFQRLLLDKEVKFIGDVSRIDPIPGSNPSQSLLGTIRILLDPFSKTRSIMYFRHTAEHKDFVEWPVSTFKTPHEPTKKFIKLHSLEDKPLSQLTNLARRSTHGSIATMASDDTQPGAALARNQDKTSLKGLVIEFYDLRDCHKFWLEFTTKESRSMFHLDLSEDLQQDHGLGLDFKSPSPT